MLNQTAVWIIFGVTIVLMLALDLGLFHRQARRVELREALLWSVAWIVVALLFNVLILFWRGPQSALEFLTGYLIEKSLSIDNIFVFLLVFSYFEVPPEYRHKVLFWGVLGAILTRGIFIAIGVTLIHRLDWVLYLFGALLVGTGLKTALQKRTGIDPERNPVVRFFRQHVPMTEEYQGNRFFIWRDGHRVATPLLVVLLVIESTDVFFAIDSVPAIFAVTTDPLIVYTSNIFAILGVRALFFVLEGIVGRLRYLRFGLGAILVFVGCKMLLREIYEIPVGASLVVVIAILTIAVIASLSRRPIEKAKAIIEAQERQ